MAGAATGKGSAVRVGVIGAGAVGGAFAARLERAGHEVRVVARPWTAEVLRERGLVLEGAFGEAHAHPEAVVRLREEIDLALVATKVHDAEDAIRSNLDALRGVPLVVLQNGLGGISLARRVLGTGTPVFGGLTLFAANTVHAGRVRVTAAGATFIGEGSGPARAQAVEVAGVLDEALPTRAVDNFQGAAWTKLLVNHLNAIPAITGLSVQEVSADAGLCGVLTRSMRETIAVARSMQVRFTSLGPLRRRDIWLLERLPLGPAMAVPRRLGAGFGPVPNYASTLQSIRRGQRTEIDELNGRVAELGRLHGVPTPVNRILTALVHQVERSGAFFAPATLLRLVNA